jgi:hypothetical protein
MWHLARLQMTAHKLVPSLFIDDIDRKLVNSKPKAAMAQAAFAGLLRRWF